MFIGFSKNYRTFHEKSCHGKEVSEVPMMLGIQLGVEIGRLSYRFFLQYFTDLHAVEDCKLPVL